MPELGRTEVAVVLVAASPEAVDAVAAGAEAIRTAPDEALLLAAPGSAADLVTAVAKRAHALDDDAVVLDATDGWAVWTLAGPDARAAFAYLSALHLPEGDGAIQGEVVRVPMKVVAQGDDLHLLVPAMWEAHLRERVLADCAALGVTEVPASRAWTPTAPPKRSKKRDAS